MGFVVRKNGKGRQWRPLKLIPRRKSGNYRHRHDRGFLCAVIHHNEKQPVSQHERPAMRFNSSSCLSVVQKQKAPTVRSGLFASHSVAQYALLPEHDMNMPGYLPFVFSI